MHSSTRFTSAISVGLFIREKNPHFQLDQKGLGFTCTYVVLSAFKLRKYLLTFVQPSLIYLGNYDMHFLRSRAITSL